MSAITPQLPIVIHTSMDDDQKRAPLPTSSPITHHVAHPPPPSASPSSSRPPSRPPSPPLDHASITASTPLEAIVGRPHELMVTDADDSGEDIDVHTEAALHERAPPTPAPLHREVCHTHP